MSDSLAHVGIRLIPDKCTSCMVCVRECPVWCISLESHTEPVPGAPVVPGRTRTHNVLDEFTIDWGRCQYCGVCIEECPFDALLWTAEPPAAGVTRESLVHGRDSLDVEG